MRWTDRVLGVGVLALLLTGCAAERSKPTEPPPAPSEPAAALPAPPPPAAPAAPAAEQELDQGKEAEPSRAPASRAAPSRSLPGDERALDGQTDDLDRALKLDARDCDSAGQHKDAICDIAKRICTLLDDGGYRASTEDPKRACDSARRRCQEAGSRYTEACE
jgi:hypothetical protein